MKNVGGTVLILLLLMSICLADVVDFSADGRSATSSGPWAFRTNPAGIVENEVRQILLSNTLRISRDRNVRSFTFALIEPPIDTLAGVVAISAEFSDFNQERLSFIYGVAGTAGLGSLGLNFGIERVVQNAVVNTSVVLDLGAKGKFSEGGALGYGLTVKNFRIWSSNPNLVNQASVGAGVCLDYDQMKFALDVMYGFNDLWTVCPGAQLSIEPLNLYVTVPLFYTVDKDSVLAVDIGGSFKVGNLNIQLSLFYPFSKVDSSDFFKELNYDYHIDFRIGVRW
ncbi:hypothetical protein [Pseudothermotoga sp.]|nr:hypothetical protein [Pseudothermotoga sp.]MCX7812340.1 hypothetical protein [Pseudothermotoga sp.]MDW8139410.1 hypothetical protein [Pseudothermotoga sp.]